MTPASYFHHSPLKADLTDSWLVVEEAGRFEEVSSWWRAGEGRGCLCKSHSGPDGLVTRGLH